MAEEKVSSVETTVREIRWKTRKKYNAEEKMRIVLEGLRRETSIAELCLKTMNLCSVDGCEGLPLACWWIFWRIRSRSRKRR